MDQVWFPMMKWAQMSQNRFFLWWKIFIAEPTDFSVTKLSSQNFFDSVTHHRNITGRSDPRVYVHSGLRPLWQLMWHAVNAVKWRGQDIVALHVVSFTLAGDVLGRMRRKEDSHVARGCKSMSFCYEGTCHFHICPRVLFLCSHVSVVGCPMCLLLGDPRVIFVLIQVLFSYWSMVGKRMTKVLPKELITATKSWKSCC